MRLFLDVTWIRRGSECVNGFHIITNVWKNQKIKIKHKRSNINNIYERRTVNTKYRRDASSYDFGCLAETRGETEKKKWFIFLILHSFNIHHSDRESWENNN